VQAPPLTPEEPSRDGFAGQRVPEEKNIDRLFDDETPVDEELARRRAGDPRSCQSRREQVEGIRSPRIEAASTALRSS